VYCDKSLGHVAVENPRPARRSILNVSSSNCEFLRDRELRALMGAEGEVPEMFRETYFLDPFFSFPDLFVGVNGSPLDDDSASSTFWTYKTAFRKKRKKERERERKCLRKILSYLELARNLANFCGKF